VLRVVQDLRSLKRHIPDEEDISRYNEQTGNEEFEENVTFEWETKAKKNLQGETTCFPQPVINAVVDRLFYHPGQYGGRISDACSSVKGFCEYRDQDGNIYRSDPQFLQEGEWFDWAFFMWEGIEEPIVARILMMLDLSDAEIEYEDRSDADGGEEEQDNNVHFLTRDKWCLVRAGQSPRLLPGQAPLTDNHFESSISDRVLLEQEFRLVPLSCVQGPAFVIENYPTLGNEDKLEGVKRPSGTILNPYDNTVIVVKPRKEWASRFIID